MSRTCRVGIHGRNNPDFQEVDFEVMRDAKVEAVKMMSQTHPQVFERIKTELPGVEIITRLYEDRIGAGHHPTPQDYVSKMIPIIGTLKPYCEKFHITNEPNHVHRYEGWGATDEDAQNFNQWYLEVLDRLRQAHPDIKYGFPGLAVPDAGHRDRAWLDICAESVAQSDWLGVHCYWQTPNDGRPSVIFDDNFGLTFKYYHQKFPDKVLEILECGNSNIQNNYPISEEDVAKEYTDWLKEVFKYSYINSASFFILSSQDRGNWEFFSWRLEDERIKPVTYRVGEMGRPDRRSVVLDVETEEPPEKPADDTAAPDTFTNQNMIDALRMAGKALGKGGDDGWGLMEKAGLSLGDLVAKREAPYSGPPLSQLNLSRVERQTVSEQLAVLAPNFDTPDNISGEAVTFANQNLIDAFSMAAKKLGFDDPWALMTKAGLSLGALIEKRWDDYTGPRVSQNQYLTEAEKSAVKAELLTVLELDVDDDIPNFSLPEDMGRYLRTEDELIGIPLTLPQADHLDPAAAQNGAEQRVVEVWNRFGWVLAVLADVMAVRPSLVVAVVANEPILRGLDARGRLTIRFEPAMFYEKWGRTHQAEFEAEFADEAAIHVDQASEWAAFERALALDEDAARQSIAMGIPQILGCNYELVGYNSTQAMYTAFASSERCQLVGLFDLIGGAHQQSRQIEALQAEDLESFAALYRGGRGSETTAQYWQRLRQAMYGFERLWQSKS